VSFPTPPASQSDGYQAYMMRLWQAGSNGTWRVSLQSVQTGETVRFPNLESLLAFLQAQDATRDTDTHKDNARKDDAGNVIP
jgi:hypothetical protein